MADSHSVACLCCSLAPDSGSASFKNQSQSSDVWWVSAVFSQNCVSPWVNLPAVNWKGHMLSEESRLPFRERVFGILVATFSFTWSGSTDIAPPVVRVTFFTLRASSHFVYLPGFLKSWSTIFIFCVWFCPADGDDSAFVPPSHSFQQHTPCSNESINNQQAAPSGDLNSNFGYCDFFFLRFEWLNGKYLYVKPLFRI